MENKIMDPRTNIAIPSNKVIMSMPDLALLEYTKALIWDYDCGRKIDNANLLYVYNNIMWRKQAMMACSNCAGTKIDELKLQIDRIENQMAKSAQKQVKMPENEPKSKHELPSFLVEKQPILDEITIKNEILDTVLPKKKSGRPKKTQ